MRTLFAGPFIGELGWELFCWQGFIRKIASKFERVVIACRTGHDALYADFADDILHFDEGTMETDMCYDRSVKSKEVISFRRYVENFAPDAQWVKPNAFPSRWWDSEPWSARQSFVRLGGDSIIVSHPDVLLHVRNTQKCNTEFRNWPVEDASDVAHLLMERGYSVACIGRHESSTFVAGGDLRGISLAQLTNAMASSKLIIGPQSGPTHLATLCGLPQLCWQTCRDHVARVTTHWNPFNTHVTIMQSPGDSYWKKRKMWLPESIDIVEKAKLMLEKTDG